MLPKYFDSDEEFCWEGDESGIEIMGPSAASCISNDAVSFYPLGHHIVIEICPNLPPMACPLPTTPLPADCS